MKANSQSTTTERHKAGKHTDSGSNSEESGIFTYASTSSKTPGSLNASIHNLTHARHHVTPPPHNSLKTFEIDFADQDINFPAPDKYKDEVTDRGSEPDLLHVHYDANLEQWDSVKDLAANSVTDTSTGESAETVIHKPLKQ